MKRSESCELAARNSFVFKSLHQDLLIDNWFHARKFLQGIKFLASHTGPIVDSAEKDLMAILAVCDMTSDPMPWLLILDYILRRLWKDLIREEDLPPAKRRRTSVQKSRVAKEVNMNRVRAQFNELTIFMHGAMVTVIVARFPRKPIWSLLKRDKWNQMVSFWVFWPSLVLKYLVVAVVQVTV